MCCKQTYEREILSTCRALLYCQCHFSYAHKLYSFSIKHVNHNYIFIYLNVLLPCLALSICFHSQLCNLSIVRLSQVQCGYISINRDKNLMRFCCVYKVQFILPPSVKLKRNIAIITRVSNLQKFFFLYCDRLFIVQDLYLYINSKFQLSSCFFILIYKDFVRCLRPCTCRVWVQRLAAALQLLHQRFEPFLLNIYVN